MFVFRLCLALGVWHPSELLDSLTWEQVEDWRQFYEADPWGEERADMRAENQRLLSAGAEYPTGAPPEPIWPYYRPEIHSLDEMLRIMKERKHARRNNRQP